mgnify:CR=1 FL=1
MDKKILITGGAGFIASNLLHYFVKKYPEYQWINFDALTYAGNLENLKEIENEPNYTFFKGDIRNSEDVVTVFQNFGITDVMHLAAESHVDRSMVNPTLFVETNVMGTINLLNAAREYWKEDYSKHRFINFSTDEIYGHLTSPEEPAFNENTPLAPRSPYATSKAAQTMFGYTYFNAYGVPVINTSCGNIIGPYQFPEKLVPLTIDRLIHKEKIPVYGKGEQRRDWTAVADVCKAVDIIFNKGKVGEMYCIGGDGECSNIEMIEAIIKAMVDIWYEEEKKHRRWIVNPKPLRENVYKALINFIPDPRGNAHDFRYDIDHSKLTNELGWKPEYTFEKNVRETVQWYLDNQEWVEHCKSGEYKNWIKEYYK